MALIHDAELAPTKLDLLRSWLPTRRWAPTGPVGILGAYRFDDPEGAVGIETFLLAADGLVLQVPVTYRGNPVNGAAESLIGTMDHSVLGPRWAYDAATDPVYVRALTVAITTGGTQADLQYDYPVAPKKLIVTTRVAGSGTPENCVPRIGSVSAYDSDIATRIAANSVTIEVVRVVDTGRPRSAEPSLVGTWPGQQTASVLATMRPD